jgi:hypothetical protein
MDYRRGNFGHRRELPFRLQEIKVMRPEPETIQNENELPDVPGFAETDWDLLATGQLLSELPFEEGEPNGSLPEEDDDNPFQESDEALPDDREEHAMKRGFPRDRDDVADRWNEGQ